VTAHAQALSGLAASTLYHYRVKSRDAAGNLATSGDVTFTTSPAADVTAPVISAVAAGSITTSGAVIAWTTSEASDAQVEYGVTSAYGSSTTLTTSMVASHARTLSGLAASTLYHYRVKSRDAAGNLAVSGDHTFTTSTPADTTAPTISALAASSISASGATISWTTNEGADSQVEYGTTTAYGSASALNTVLVTTHAQTLTGLAASTLYHYRVKSRDTAGNLAVSLDASFTTATAPSGQAPFLGQAFAAPCLIQVEDYDLGGEGVAYHDEDGVNGGAAYRTDGVDVRVNGAYTVVFNARAGEWLEYTVDVASAGTYQLGASAASRLAGGTLHIDVDGIDATGPLTVPATGGWRTFVLVAKDGVILSAGRHVLRLALDTNGVEGITADFDSLQISPSAALPSGNG
jgi:phosphodiesterase/alkaline phosphatase D-like protein